MSGHPIDFTALERDPTERELSDVRAQARKGAFGKATQKDLVGPDAAGCAAGVITGFFGLILAITALVQVIQGDPDLYITGIFFVGVLVIGAFLYAVFSGQERRGWRRSVKLVLFARANPGFEFLPLAKASRRPATVASQYGKQGSLADLMTWTVDGRAAQSGHYYRNTGGQTVDVRYLGVRLDLDVPEARLSHRGKAAFGPDAFGGTRDYTLSNDAIGFDERLLVLFDDTVCGLLAEREVPATYDRGWFVATYGWGKDADPELWRHKVALVDAVVAAATRLRG